MKVFTTVVWALLQILASQAFVIPDELPSILSVIYSNIPTIKKGTDSRLGWGFRLGERADFQVLVELGPQTNTQPLANQGDNANKRQAIKTLADQLYAQRQQEKKIQKLQKQEQQNSNSEGGKWLENWSKKAQQNDQENEALPLKPKPGIAIGEIDAKSVIPDDTVLAAQELKKEKLHKPIRMAVSNSEPKTSRTTVKTTTKPLDDVDLE